MIIFIEKYTRQKPIHKIREKSQRNSAQRNDESVFSLCPLKKKNSDQSFCFHQPWALIPLVTDRVLFQNNVYLYLHLLKAQASINVFYGSSFHCWEIVYFRREYCVLCAVFSEIFRWKLFCVIQNRRKVIRKW